MPKTCRKKLSGGNFCKRRASSNKYCWQHGGQLSVDFDDDWMDNTNNIDFGYLNSNDEEPVSRNEVNTQPSKLNVVFLKPSIGIDAKEKPEISDWRYLKSWLKIKDEIPTYKWDPSANSGYSDPMYYANKKYQFFSVEDFKTATKLMKETFDNHYNNSSLWVGNKKPTMDYQNDPIFVQKVQVPNDAKIFILGDLHSSLTSLLNILNDLKDHFVNNFSLKPNHYLFFLGDIVDRGPYGLELLVLVGLLKSANPKQVFIINGNHEDFNVYSRYGLLVEIALQFKLPKEENKELSNKLLDALHYLPSAIFIEYGERTYQLCHGALPNRDDDRDEILDLLAEKNKEFALLQWNKKDGELTYVVDDLKWGDFKGSDGKSRGRGGPNSYTYGKDEVERYLRFTKITSIFSGHQDNSNLTFIPTDLEVGWMSNSYDSTIFEPDTVYNNLYRPLGYDELLSGTNKKELSYVPGKDFIALNTSTAYISKGYSQDNDALKYDCYLILTLDQKNSRVNL